ncbi:MAG: flap endonuclease-1 [Candidatus Nanoarchaeia archaeon]|nr:flap endonuclease-1 [Candidatus Haiyanarchaeum thermophilum]MCW1303403.1 flap endonuclease-1 [Candidatus Haiyanarchaeum thermophilum]MCW1303910.1 flap endonuclease-1 [Candidatus Haiyanarchaeum thermophilum]MCW1306765.1 flap endonuclease-1 [Candidatus Haiyanarchaeum thermophilum]MCW1307429.1 flap endonuclease-1 [Candidatus Haiyanarchaeum thermophilum]
MGVNLRDITTVKHEVELKDLIGKKVAIDAFNAIMQFLTVIRQRDGIPLMDSRGNVTSHLSGLFYRTCNLLVNGIWPCYVFDGEPPPFKHKTIEKRVERREDAARKYEEALKKGIVEEAYLYAQQTASITEQIISESKRLLEAMGIPCVMAATEGEAQCAYMCRVGDVDFSASQDWDSLLFGSPRLVRNLNVVGKRKLPRKEVYVEIKPEVIYLDELLSSLGINREKLILIGILVGTDYNPEGIKGIGPKRALELVKKKNVEEVMRELKWEFEVDWREILQFFLEPKINPNYKLEWKELDKEKVMKILCDEHDFSADRVEKSINEVLSKAECKKQVSLERFFK